MYAERQYRPHPLLDQYVETYWASVGLLNQEDITQILPEDIIQILPDGCVDIVFTFNEGRSCIPDIVGTMTSPLDVRLIEQVKMIGITFKPGGITAFTKMPINEFTNLLVDIDLCETIFDKSFYESLDGKSTEDIISFFDEYLLQRLPSIFEIDNRINYAVSLIKENRGEIEIPSLA